MSRGIGEFEVIQDLIPEWLAVIIALITQLGDVWFLVTVLAVLYWIHHAQQDDIALVAGIWLVGMALYLGLKEVFGLPRPAEPLLDPGLLPWFIEPIYQITAFASGYGVPSGHAVNATIVYLGLATVLTVGTKRGRFITAGTIIALVGFTRVALGVHYLVDIVAGVTVGVVVLIVGFHTTTHLPGDRISITFAIAIATAAFYVLVSNVEFESLVILGISLGTFTGWQLVMLGRHIARVDRPSEMIRPTFIRGGLAVITGGLLVAMLEHFPPLSAYAVAGTVGLFTIAVVIIPIMRYSRIVHRGWIGLTFYMRATRTEVNSLLESLRRLVQR